MSPSRLLCAGLSCIVFAGLAAAQTSPFQLTVTQGGNAFVITNGSSLAFSDPVGQSETVRITAIYVGLGQVAISQAPQILGSPAFTLSFTAKLPLTLNNGDRFAFDITFRPNSATQSNAQLAAPYIETLSGGPPTFAPTFVNGSINLSLQGSSPSFVLSYILRTDQNVVTVPPGGSIVFPPTPINTNAQATFNITNRGSGPGAINAISITGAAFKPVGLPLFPTTVAANQTLQVLIQYAPTVAGSDTGQVQITIDPNTTLTVGLQGTGMSTASAFAYSVIQGTTSSPLEPGGAISAFTDTNVGESISLAIQVKNTGNAPGPITSLSLVGAGFQLSDLPGVLPTLAPNASLTFTVTFLPPRPGNFTGRLTIGSDSFSLLARGLGPNLAFSYISGDTMIPLTSTNPVLFFSPVMISTSARSDFVVSNTGTLPATLANIGVVEPNSPFSISDLPALPVTIPPNADFHFTVIFKPVTIGFSSGSLRLDAVVVGLTGSGTPPPPLPGYTLQGPTGRIDPQSQPAVTLSLSSPYPLSVAGTLTMSVSSDLPVDPAVQFSTGGRTAQFLIPANSTDAIFTGQGPQARLQTGTVAGTIVLTPSFSVQGSNITLTPDSPRSLQFDVPSVAPVLFSGRVANPTANGFSVVFTGYSTTRSIASLNAQFAATAGFTVPQTQFTVDLRQASSAWFQTGGSQAFGGQFTLAVPFIFRGTAPAGHSVLESVGSLTVSVTNESGTSNSNTRFNPILGRALNRALRRVL